jgi:hypothetical protein
MRLAQKPPMFNLAAQQRGVDKTLTHRRIEHAADGGFDTLRFTARRKSRPAQWIHRDLDPIL